MSYSLYVIAAVFSTICSVVSGTIIFPPPLPVPVCYQPKQPGICQAYFPRWWFNSATRKCEQFIYGGCGGNSNNFMTELDCYAKCDVCQLPIKPDGGGPVVCLAYIPSYGFNTTSCKCDKFIYSGCGGNENRFGTLEACSDKCVGTPCASNCALPADPGPCEALMRRYFYNTKTCQCEKFNYGGCRGNSNNFLSMEECLRSCRGFSSCDTNPNQCYLPEDSGTTCKEPDDRFRYDPLECKCKKFSFGGCEGNDNNFLSKRQCKRSCGNATCPICNLPKVPGPCRGSFPRYFYNIQTCQCEKFIYGGCGGNENQFTSLEDCQAICGTVQCPVCNLPSSKGPCKARLKRWYFDAAECTCKTFIYGGCGGNMNRFLTESDCEGSCGSYPCPVCSLPKQVGPCRAAIKRWYYDSAKHQCRAFSWGGCKPNGNNFRSKKLCKKVCNDFRCLLPVQVGPCKGSKPRFYFDKNTGKCKSFSWGGCESNGNNFKTLEGCENLCL